MSFPLALQMTVFFPERGCSPNPGHDRQRPSSLKMGGGGANEASFTDFFLTNNGVLITIDF